MRFCLVLLLLSLVGSARAAASFDPLPGADEKWRRYESPHFELYSRNSEGDSRQLLHNLELIHTIFFETFGFKVSRAVPVTVYFFSREKYFEAYKPEAMRKIENLSAFYYGDLDRGVMTVAPVPDYESAQRLAFGSYTFHLFRLMGERPPPWFSYGMSGLMTNLNLLPETFELGKSDPQQVSRLQDARLLPLGLLFGADQESSAFRDNQSNHLFHDETWALVHYLYFGQHKLPKEKVSAFVNFAVSRNGSYDAAVNRQVFEQTLGLTYEKMDAALERYFRGGRYSYSKVPLPKIPPAGSYAMRKVPLDEIRLRLAELGLRVNRTPEGKLALLKVPADSRDAARTQEVLAAEAAKAGEWDQVGDRLRQAIEAGSANPAVMHELAQFEDRQRFRNFDLYYRLPDEAAARLRDLAQRAIAIAPMQGSSYELLAWVEATAREPKIANVNLVQRNFDSVQDKPRTLVAVAVVHMRLGDKAGAAEILDQLAKSHPDDWVAYALEYTRARLEDRPVNRDNLPAGRSASRDPVLQRGFAKPGT